jgi:hypothetical protein
VLARAVHPPAPADRADHQECFTIQCQPEPQTFWSK